MACGVIHMKDKVDNADDARPSDDLFTDREQTRNWHTFPQNVIEPSHTATGKQLFSAEEENKEKRTRWESFTLSFGWGVLVTAYKHENYAIHFVG